MFKITILVRFPVTRLLSLRAMQPAAYKVKSAGYQQIQIGRNNPALWSVHQQAGPVKRISVKFDLCRSHPRAGVCRGFTGIGGPFEFLRHFFQAKKRYVLEKVYPCWLWHRKGKLFFARDNCLLIFPSALVTGNLCRVVMEVFHP
ncbi:hypothetical protein [Enterobacter mori]|uniref:hypothetical protein n=1 Tax=Enterobacter mori TaxID=539813 RepID=UPI001B8D118F|nr:hypothetical protein [Enterobacter mori]